MYWANNFSLFTKASLGYHQKDVPPIPPIHDLAAVDTSLYACCTHFTACFYNRNSAFTREHTHPRATLPGAFAHSNN
jgi:hypothetical protein